MKKSSTELKNCTSNARSQDDRGPHTISRRSFIQSSALVVLPTLCAGCTDDPLVALPPVANRAIAVPLERFPDLMRVGGSIVGTAAGYPNPIVIARVRDDTFAALDAICTHMRCTVAYNALNLTLDCPCHGSTYEVTGTVIGGPAPRPLTTFTAQSDGTTLTIMLP